VKKTTNVAADGSFKLELEYPLPYQQIWFSVGEIFYAGLYANKDLHVELDIKKIKESGKELDFNGDGVRYLGTDGPLNDYMNNYVLFKREEQLALSSRQFEIPRSRTPQAAKLISAYDNIFDSLKMIQDDYIAHHPSPYAWMLENERISDYYGMICLNFWGHAMENELFDKMKQHKTYLVSNNSTSFYRYLSTHISTHPANRIKVDWKDVAKLPDLNDAEKMAIDSLRMAEVVSAKVDQYTLENIQKWSKQLSPRIQKIQQDQKIDKVIHFLDSSFPSPRADIMKLQLNESKDLVEQQAALERILPSMQTNWCKLVAKTEYAKTTNKIAEVNKALAGSGSSITAAGFGKPFLQTNFGASMYKVSDMKAADFLAKLRKSFPGKAIVFDLWATWCAPCLAEMPHSKKLQQDSKGLQVVFVYVCTINNSNESKWKNKVGELKLPGVHFFIDQALDAELSQYFSFSGYPGYAFIDRNGVYKAGAIKRVSDIKDRKAMADLID
jgi:thiol-disulfide isomerase/thioredoxin